MKTEKTEDLANQIKKGNYSLESDSQTYDFDNGKIFFNSNIYVKEKVLIDNGPCRFDAGGMFA